MTEDTIITNDTAETPYVCPARPDGSAQVRTVRFEISFDGTGYHGWQRQPNGITVQEVLEERLSKLFGDAQIRIQGSSRTDAGVHALGLVGSCRLPELEKTERLPELEDSRSSACPLRPYSPLKRMELRNRAGVELFQSAEQSI